MHPWEGSQLVSPLELGHCHRRAAAARPHDDETEDEEDDEQDEDLDPAVIREPDE